MFNLPLETGQSVMDTRRKSAEGIASSCLVEFVEGMYLFRRIHSFALLIGLQPFFSRAALVLDYRDATASSL